MAFTGRLGTDESQLGNIQPGAEGSWSEDGAFQNDAFQSDAFQVEGGATVSDDFSLDAVILKTQSGGFDLNAVIQAEQTDSFSLDAVLSLLGTGSVALDAVILVTQTGSYPFDAIIETEQTGSFGLDAVFGALFSAEYTFVLSAYIVEVPAFIGTFGINAEVIGGVGLHSRADDHFGTQDDTTIVLADPIAEYAAGTTLATILADLYGLAAGLEEEPQGRLGINAWIHPYLSLDAVIRGPQSAAFGIDARIGRGASFGINAIVRERFVTTQFGINAFIVG